MLLLVLASLVNNLPWTGLASTTDASVGSSSKILFFKKKKINFELHFKKVTYEHETKLR